ncbi:chromate efflux transporter [Marinomonas epiphytica]
MTDIFKTFFLLGCYCFGGPAAHIGYFRNHFVERRNWLSEEEFAQIVALSQFLPGPGSSQVGFALGYKKGGIIGACAAFLGFTLPSVLLMLLLASIGSYVTDMPFYQGWVHGLKLLAVVVVADATLGMYRSFCTSKLQISLAVLTAVVLLVLPSLGSQMLVLILAGAIGASKLSARNEVAIVSFKPSYAPLALFVLLLIALPLFAAYEPLIMVFNQFYQAGSLVFGGGHVVLPLMQEFIGDQLSSDQLLTGYAAAQAVPGPMFTLATYYGYEILNQSVFAALLATLAVFLPGFLLLLVVLKNWQALAHKPRVAGALKGINASVVGLLIAALYQPVFSTAVLSGTDLAAVLLGLFLLKQFKVSILWLILAFSIFGTIL